MRARTLWLLSFAVCCAAAACAANDARSSAPGGDGSVVAEAAVDAASDLLDPRLGGMTTSFKDQADAFSFSSRNMHQRDDIVFARGTDDFNKAFDAPGDVSADGSGRTGLGPTYNAVACASCHVNHGRGLQVGDLDAAALAPGVAPPMPGLLLRVSLPGATTEGAPVPDPTYGDQIQDHAVAGAAPEGRVVVSYAEVAGAYGDATPFSLRRPTYSVEDIAHGPLADGIAVSPRLAPPVIGMGLLEAVPEADIVARADPDDRDGDGVRGRPNRVWDVRRGTLVLGRFGWKANQPTVEQQTAGALLGDLGVTTSLTGTGVEYPDERFHDLVAYTRTLAVPAMRDTADPTVRRGAELFGSIGCAACHTPTSTTGDDEVSGLARQRIHAFTDLLLHDMGDGLADGRPDFAASGRDWRTPPLWGIGLTEVVGGRASYLHDGRARTLEEAILWHGGEAAPASERFRTVSKADRDALLRYLRAL